MSLKLYKSDMVGYGAGPAASTDFWGTETWTEVPGLVSLQLHRMSNAYASYVEIKVAGSTLPVDLGQRILLGRSELSVAVNVDFVGRVDDVQPSRDTRMGQMWTIRARDYLAVLQDNYIEARGRDRYGKASINEGGETAYAEAWEPAWAPGTLANPSGSMTLYRARIAAELAMNFVDIPNGIRDVNIVAVPLASDGLNKLDMRSLTNKTIADAIRDLLKDDPWIVSAIGSTTLSPDIVAAGISSTDAEALMLADGVTQIPGIGTEFIIDYNPPIGQQLYGNSVVTDSPGSGPVAYVNKGVRYAMPFVRMFARGVYNFDTAIQFWYGDASAGRWPILSYKFPKEGSSVYTRGKVVGRADAEDQLRQSTFLKYATSPTGQGSFKRVSPDYAYGGGGWIPDNDDEVDWAPGSNHYAMRRTGLANDEAVPAEVNEELVAAREAFTDKAELARLRAIGMTQTPGSLKPYIRGQIKVPGLPRNTASYPLVPGVVISVNLPPLFIANTFYVVDSYTYSYPEDVTTIELARRPWDDLSEQLKRSRNFSLATGSQGKSRRDTGWQIAPGSRSLVVQHNWGQVPTSVVIRCAEQDGTKTDQNGRPIPKAGTEVEMTAATFDPNNGAWVGGARFKGTDRDVTVSYSGQMVYSDGAGRWLEAGRDLIRVVLRG